MHELYLWPFVDAVKAGTGSIMCSYERINNSYGCHNAKTQNGILNTELGFQGFIVSGQYWKVSIDRWANGRQIGVLNTPAWRPRSEGWIW